MTGQVAGKFPKFSTWVVQFEEIRPSVSEVSWESHSHTRTMCAAIEKSTCYARRDEVVCQRTRGIDISGGASRLVKIRPEEFDCLGFQQSGTESSKLTRKVEQFKRFVHRVSHVSEAERDDE